MSNFDNFDIDQISSKFAQRLHFICYFYCKKISILSGLDNAKNAKRQFLLDTQYNHICHTQCNLVPALTTERKVLSGEEFKRYVNKLRLKSNVYQKKKSDLADLKGLHSIGRIWRFEQDLGNSTSG